MHHFHNKFQSFYYLQKKNVSNLKQMFVKLKEFGWMEGRNMQCSDIILCSRKMSVF